MALPPSLWAELFFDGTWNDITADVRQTAAATVTRGQTSESSSSVPPTASSLVLNNRSRRYAPRNPGSELYDKIGRNTPLRWGYREGSPYVSVTGVDGNLISTPSSSAFNVTDLDLRLDLALESWAAGQNLAARYVVAGDQRSWFIQATDAGQLFFAWSPDGTLAARILQASTVPLVAYNGQRIAIRITLDVNNGAGGYTLRFYTGRTVDDEEHEWTQLGDTITGGATTSVFSASAPIELGDSTGITEDSMNGKLFAFKLLSGIGTAGLIAASMVTSDASAGVSSFSSGGVTWTASGGATLSDKHTRMSGEVPEWPSNRDRSGNDTTVSVAPTDITRRMGSGSKPVDSGLLRYIQANNPVEFWPLTDGPSSLNARNFVPGGQSMSTGLTNGTIRPEWAKEALGTGLEPVFAAKKETSGYLKADTRNSTAAASAWAVDYFLRTEAQGDIGTIEIRDRGLATDADNLVYFQITANQTDDTLSIFRFSRGETTNSFALVSTINAPGIFDGQMHMIRFAVDPGATDTGWNLYVDGVSLGSGTISSIVVKALSRIGYTWSLETGADEQKADELIGFITYWDSTGPAASTVWGVATGLQGERAGTRAERVAGEGGYTLTSYGQTAAQQRMGIQTRKKLPEVLSSAAATDFGYVLGARDRLEGIFRSGSTLWNQHPALTLDFSAGLLPDYKYRDDDLLTENDVTVTREGGSSSQQVLEEGRLSVQDFPDGVGRYDVAPTYSLYADEQTAHTASMLLHLGTFDGIRYTRITLDLANPRVNQMLDDILRTDVGDLIRLTNLPQEQGADAVDSLVVGYSEEAGPTSWKITFICVPAEPFNGLLVEVARRDRFDTGACQLNEALDETETAVDVLTTGLARWIDSAAYAGDFPFDIVVGGEVMRVLMCGPILNSNPTFESGVAGWTATNATIEAFSGISPDGSNHIAKLTSTAGSTPRAASALCPVVAGQSYAAVGWLMAPVTLPSTAGVNINWRNSGGSLISTSSNALTLTAGQWTSLSNSFTAPVGAVNAEIVMVEGGTPGAGFVLYADNVALIDAALVNSLSQTFQVIRSVNGVQKSHASGAGARLFTPVYFQL